MVALVSLVIFLGRITYQEGVKTRTTKSEAETLLSWMKQASSMRSGTDFEPAACAYKSAGATADNTWGGCASALVAAGGPLGNVRNAFSSEPLALIDRCKTSDLSTAGQIMIERIAPTPPGAAVPFVVGGMAVDEAIGQKLNIRITVCDKGGYPIRVGESEF